MEHKSSEWVASLQSTPLRSPKDSRENQNGFRRSAVPLQRLVRLRLQATPSRAHRACGTAVFARRFRGARGSRGRIPRRDPSGCLSGTARFDADAPTGPWIQRAYPSRHAQYLICL